MKNIYNIQQEFLQLESKLIENEGELTPEIETALQINRDDLEHKGIQYGYVIKSLESNNDEIDTEIKRLQAIKKSNSNALERLKTTLSTAMQLFEINELKTATLKVNFRKSESVEIEDIDALSPNFITIKQTINPDRVAIKEAIRRGEFVSGAKLVTNHNIQIK